MYSDELTNGNTLQNPENSGINESQNINEATVVNENIENSAVNSDVIMKYATDAEYQNAYQAISNDISIWCESVKTINDWKTLRNNQIELRGALKMLFLSKEDTKKLNDLIDEHAEIIDERQNVEKMEKDKLFENNYNELKEKVIDVCNKANQTSVFKEGRDLLVKLQDEIKPIPLKRSQREEFFSLIQAAFLSINEKQASERENFEMECIENYHSLKKVIEEACTFSKESPRFTDARKKLIDVQKLIKGKKLRREQRDELYQIIRDYFDALNQRQTAEKSINEEEISANYSRLSKVVSEAIDFANTTEEYGEARARLISAQNEIKSLKLNRNQRDELFAAIREVFTKMNDMQSSEREAFETEAEENYIKLTEKINNCFELVLGLTDFRLIRENLLAIQGEVKIIRLKRSHRNELFARLREAFNLFDKKRDDFFSVKREERKRKFTTNLDNIKAKITRLEELKAKDIELLSQIGETEEEERVNNLKARIQEKESQINEANVKYQELLNEMNEIDKENDAEEASLSQESEI